MLTDPAFWFAVVCWLIPLGIVVLSICKAAARGDRMMARARADVAVQARAREFAACDVDDELADVVELPERELPEIAPIRGGIGGWRR